MYTTSTATHVELFAKLEGEGVMMIELGVSSY